MTCSVLSGVTPSFAGIRPQAALIAAACLLAPLAATPAAAQDRVGVPYVVGRLGVQLDSDLRSKGRDIATPSTVPGNTDFRRGSAGEAGIGYDFGNFRVETTIGYETAAVNAKALDTGGLTTTGRTKALNLGVSAYYDFGVAGPLRPFVGGGIGASRVSTSFSRVTAAGIGSRIDDRDWGFRWHAGAGVGYDLSAATTVEVGARYSRTTGLRLSGTQPGAGTAQVPYEYRPRQSATTLLVGLRQRF